MVREELHGFGNALDAILRNINVITAVVFRGSAKIPAPEYHEVPRCNEWWRVQR